MGPHGLGQQRTQRLDVDGRDLDVLAVERAAGPALLSMSPATLVSIV
jgi:hypothetical protein